MHVGLYVKSSLSMPDRKLNWNGPIVFCTIFRYQISCKSFHRFPNCPMHTRGISELNSRKARLLTCLSRVWKRKPLCTVQGKMNEYVVGLQAHCFVKNLYHLTEIFRSIINKITDKKGPGISRYINLQVDVLLNCNRHAFACGHILGNIYIASHLRRF
jgi:hypothetical protein